MILEYVESTGRIDGALATLASTATLDLAYTPNTVIVTGTTGITSLGTARQAGALRTLIFSGAVTLTHGAAAIVLPGGANLTTEAGDVVSFVSADTNGKWTCISYNKTAISPTESGYLDGLTIGTVAASKAVVADSNKDVAQFRNLAADNLIAGSASGRVGTVGVHTATARDVPPFRLDASDNGGNHTVHLKQDAHGQETVVHLGDGGAAATYLLQTTASDAATCTVSAAELNTLDGVQTPIAAPVDGVLASLSIEPGVDGNDATVYYAVSYTKSVGEAISVAHLGGVSQALAVSVIGNAITVQLGTDGGGVVTSTAENVSDAIAATPAAAALVTCFYQGTGAGLAGVAAAANLTGGVDVTPGAVGAWRFKTSDFTEGYVKVSAQVWKKFALAAV